MRREGMPQQALASQHTKRDRSAPESFFWPPDAENYCANVYVCGTRGTHFQNTCFQIQMPLLKSSFLTRTRNTPARIAPLPSLTDNYTPIYEQKKYRTPSRGAETSAPRNYEKSVNEFTQPRPQQPSLSGVPTFGRSLPRSPPSRVGSPCSAARCRGTEPPRRRLPCACRSPARGPPAIYRCTRRWTEGRGDRVHKTRCRRHGRAIKPGPGDVDARRRISRGGGQTKH